MKLRIVVAFAFTSFPLPFLKTQSKAKQPRTTCAYRTKCIYLIYLRACNKDTFEVVQRHEIIHTSWLFNLATLLLNIDIGIYI